MEITLEAARVNKRLTQREAAKMLGITRETLGRWERGVSFPSANVIPLIESLYGVSYDCINFLAKNNA